MCYFLIFNIILKKTKYHNKTPFKNIWSYKDKSELLYIIKHVYTFFKDNKIQTIPMYDTLLAIYKYGDFLPWYGCYDICVTEKDYNYIYILKSQLKKYDIYIFYTNTDMKIFTSKNTNNINWSWPYISITKFKLNKNTIYLKNNNNVVKLKYDYIYPTNTHLFNNILIDIPNKVEKVLDILFDNEWKTFCISSKYDYKNNKLYHKTFSIKWDEIDFYKEEIIFENTWVINLERCKDRWKKTKNRLHAIGIEPKKWAASDKYSKEIKEEYKKLKGLKIGMSIGVFACYVSHKKLWEYLYKIEVPYAIIFEDDIVFGDNIKQKDIINIIKNSIGFNIIFLGYTCPNRPLFSDQYVVEGGGTCLHAYVVSRKGLENLLKLKHDFSFPIDKLTKDFSENNLCYLSKNINSEHYGYGIIYQDINIESDLRFRFNIFGHIISF